MQTKIDYDSENDILYFYPNEKSVDYSIDYDDIILDVSGNKIVGVEIIDASEKFANKNEEIANIRKAMASIKEAYMNIKYSPVSIKVKIGFTSPVRNYEREGMLIQIPMSYVGCTSASSRTIKISSFPSTITNLAFASVCFTSATPLSSLTASLVSFVSGAAILILTPLFFNFSKVGLRPSTFLKKP